MEIKTVKETIPERTVERTIYVASDGKEFDNELRCREHEKDLECLALSNRLEDMRVTDRYLDEVQFAWPMFTEYITEYTERDMLIVCPKTFEDCDMLKEMFCQTYNSDRQILIGHYYLIIVRDMYDDTTWERADIRDFYDILSWTYEMQASIRGLIASQQ